MLEQGDRVGVGDFFFFENAVGEGFGGVVVEDGAGALKDDGAGVVAAVDEVDGAARQLAAVGEDGFVNFSAVHPAAAEAGEEGGVDVHGPAVIAGGEFEEAQPASEDNQVNLGLVHDGEDSIAKGGAGGVLLAVDHVGREVGFDGALGADEVGAGSDNGFDSRVKLSRGDPVEEVLEGGAGAAEKHGEFDGGRRHARCFRL